MVGTKINQKDLMSDYRFTLYGGSIELAVVSKECPIYEIKSKVIVIGCYRLGRQYYYAVKTGSDEFILIEKKYFEILY